MPQGYRFGPFELDLRTGELRRDGRRRRLPGRALRALVVLLETPGEVVTREELRRRIWPTEVHVEFEHGLNNAVHDIRRALGDANRRSVRVETVPRRGYRFLGDVETLHEELPRRRFLQAMVASVLLGFGLLGLLLFSSSRNETRGAAWSAYVRANYFLAQRTTESVRRSLHYFDESVREAPEFARGHAGRARAFHFLGAMGAIEREEARRRTEEAAEKALSLDRNCGEAIAILAESRFRFRNERDGVEELFQRAIALAPEDAETRQWYANFLALDGRLSEGLREMERALQLDPLSLPINVDLAALLYEAEQRERAMEQFERTLELDPRYAKAHFLLGFVHLAEEELDEAVASFERSVSLSPDTKKYQTTSLDALARAGFPEGVERLRAAIEKR